MKLSRLITTSACTFAIAYAHAQTSSTPGTIVSTETVATPASGKPNGVNAKDQAFFKLAAIDGMTEVEVAKLAVTNASNPQIKAFGQRMVDDHAKIDDQLKQLAAKKSVDMPTSLDAKHQAMIASLRQKRGAAFDAEFLQDMKTGHADSIKTFEIAVKSKDTDIASFATDTLPTLRDHEKMLMAMQPG